MDLIDYRLKLYLIYFCPFYYLTYVSGERALDIFCTSRIKERLHNERTGLYLMGDHYIVDEVLLELQG